MVRSSQSITATRRLAALALALGLSIAPVFAAPKVSETTRTYGVSATSVRGLLNEMNARGPRGYWAYTSWNVRWSGSCAVEVKVTYTLPKHTNPRAMPADLQREWARMLKALTAHERLHGAHGIKAGREIDQARCRNPQAIIRKYNRADLRLDRETRHGRTQGVTLN